jgi:hypothetical protein
MIILGGNLLSLLKIERLAKNGGKTGGFEAASEII